ncbi:MAG TPA: hypothetical protein VN372_03760 [Methanospirillum sp.]|nr:hypothetical protein [Methanospirillum sp.]
MPETVVIHNSTFDVWGHGESVSIEASAVPTVSISAAVGPDVITATAVPALDISTEVGKAFHTSAFDILLDRSVHITCTAVASVDVGCVPEIDLGVIRVEAVPSVGVECSTNSVQIVTKAVPSVDIEVRSVVPDDKSIKFGSLTFQCARRASEDKTTPLTESKLAELGIAEPKAFSRTISLIAETDQRYEHDKLFELIGQRLDLSVYGIVFPNATISSLSDIQRGRGGLNRFGYTIEFTHYVLPNHHSVTFGGISLSHPTRSAPDDISPSYIGNPGSGFSLNNLVATLKRTWTFECVAEEQTEYSGLISLMGPKCPLVINGETFSSVYISGLSSLVPKGTGIYLYTVELSSDSGDDPIPVTFSGISLPNAVDSGGDVEILKSRTTLYDGRVKADLGTTAADSFSFSCQSNSVTEYTAIRALIGVKATLVVDGQSVPKCYISQLSRPQKRGTATVALYTWEIGFEMETA